MSSIKKPKPTKTDSVKKRRIRKKQQYSTFVKDNIVSAKSDSENQIKQVLHLNQEVFADQPLCNGPCNCPDSTVVKVDLVAMTNDNIESKEKVKAAREAKKLAKQQAKMKKDTGVDVKSTGKNEGVGNNSEAQAANNEVSTKQVKSKDEVDRAAMKESAQPIKESEVDQEVVKSERAAKKAAKQAKKKGAADIAESSEVPKPDAEMTVRDVIQTLREIKEVAQDIKTVTAQVQTLSLDKEKKPNPSQNQEPSQSKPKQSDNSTKESEEKSKAQLKAERRSKQEAQRAAKEAAKEAAAHAKQAAKMEKKAVKNDTEKPAVVKEKSPKPKVVSKSSKQGNKVSWFRHLYNEDYKTKLNNLPVNSNLHPAVIKLGVQLATRAVVGSNARCIALLDALKKMVRDYSLPARTEFARGLEAHLAASLAYLWGLRAPAASQTNAVNFFRHRLTQLPNNVDEFDAKKTLQEEIDRYIREQIDMAGEAISIAVRNKISDGDMLLTYDCSSLIERILVEAHEAGREFRAVVVSGAGGRGREMSRRLTARGVRCVCADITALYFVMRTVNKVLLGASALLANGSVVGRAGTAAVALAARACNKPVLVACETHKFTERVQTDAFGYNEIGDPDELIGEESPLREWRSSPNLSLLNLTYDVTPPTLVTAVVTELALLPCTSAPVVLRFKLSEYGV